MATIVNNTKTRTARRYDPHNAEFRKIFAGAIVANLSARESVQLNPHLLQEWGVEDEDAATTRCYNYFSNRMMQELEAINKSRDNISQERIEKIDAALQNTELSNRDRLILQRGRKEISELLEIKQQYEEAGIDFNDDEFQCVKPSKNPTSSLLDISTTTVDSILDQLL